MDISATLFEYMRLLDSSMAFVGLACLDLGDGSVLLLGYFGMNLVVEGTEFV